MPDTVDSSAIAQDIANDVIEHHLVRQPRSAEDLERLVMKILEDRHITQGYEEIMHLATYIISNDSRVRTESKGGDEGWAIWVYHKAQKSS